MSCCGSSWPTGASCPGTNGPKSPGIDPLSPSFIGDMPHSWIGAEYILAICSLFAYEREADRSLVIAAGVAAQWLDDGGEVVVRDLPTHYGPLSYRLRRRGRGHLAHDSGGRAGRAARRHHRHAAAIAPAGKCRNQWPQQHDIRAAVGTVRGMSSRHGVAILMEAALLNPIKGIRSRG